MIAANTVRRKRLAGVIERYERIKCGEFHVLRNLERLGELLIAVRIYLGPTQAELAKRLSPVLWSFQTHHIPPRVRPQSVHGVADHAEGGLVGGIGGVSIGG